MFIYVNSALSDFAFLLPVFAIAMSWWSFCWADLGATPDVYIGDPWDEFNEQLDLNMGVRRRARMCAKACFGVGSVFLAASIPLGEMATYGRMTLVGSSGFLLVVIALLWGLLQMRSIWLDRRADAFNIYFNKEMAMLYDYEETKQEYFRLNPMPFWSLPDRSWFERRNRPPVDTLRGRMRL